MRATFNRWRRAVWRTVFYRMVFGERSTAGQLLAHTRVAPSTCIEGEAGLVLGDHVFIGQFNFIDATAGLEIAEGVQITNFVSIVTHSSHRSIRLLGRTYADGSAAGQIAAYVKAPIRIGAYSFIGPHSLIEAGAQLGKGVLVCAYSQVRGTAPDFAIMAGQPARQVGDVRQRDAELLRQYPDLAPHYQAWAGELLP
ncbi:acyltransferase [Roseateles koreensis]|uniref:Acyltransferase n=1 Tax=Roseateles koreensis TaxID=2987526 RepID=A0ABT5KM07_9BURK|nr:acyltransferase [Roseateles koreensis]MDC8783943.1 acyltransferase [Roseateles koreensis]